jgi:hypothetical protein
MKTASAVVMTTTMMIDAQWGVAEGVGCIVDACVASASIRWI